MNVPKMILSLAIAAACVAGFAGSSFAEQAKAEEGAKASAPVSQYKIGIVDRRAVLQGYNKVAEERKQLEDEVDAENKEIDKMAAELDAAKKKYDEEKDSLSSTEREEREMAIQNQFMEYQTKLQTEQAKVDSRERQLMKRFFGDIDSAVQKIGDKENYHLIIDGSKGSSTLFYAPAIDLSQKVVDYLNANAK